MTEAYVCEMAPSPPAVLTHEVFKIWCPWCGKKLAEHDTVDLGGEDGKK
jgi:hypothetical protein